MLSKQFLGGNLGEGSLRFNSLIFVSFFFEARVSRRVKHQVNILYSLLKSLYRPLSIHAISCFLSFFVGNHTFIPCCCSFMI